MPPHMLKTHQKLCYTSVEQTNLPLKETLSRFITAQKWQKYKILTCCFGNFQKETDTIFHFKIGNTHEKENEEHD